ncbi:Methyltransferase-like protein 22 [Mortierella hygrophila]|uniref:Methyltransferase-like protein 22 n=1 Tax=Mortierella hygrophila TaxID=979708 RepID=A0A9P6F8Z7_9FUNG|nr:Methyltransferase-like protein 22 [Mortierella hygrophila]
MDKTGHQFTRKEHTHDYNIDSDKDTDHRNKRQRKAEEITKSENRSDQHEHKDDHDDEDQTNEDDIVLSEVHIHPDNGLVDRRTITSTFLLSRKGQPILDSQQGSCLDSSISVSNNIKVQDDDQEDDKDVYDDEPDLWDYAVEIRHAMGTDLRGVGSQVWLGCFLLIDWIVHIRELLNDTTVLEIGAGTGLASIATDLLIAVDRVYCTDYDTNILENCMANIDLNCAADQKVKTRRLNWLLDDPMEPMEKGDHTPDPFGWSSQERQDWKDNGAFILAADVVYDDSLTDALVDCLEKLLSEPLPPSHPRHYIGRVVYMTMEKRYNFSLDELAVVAQAYEYFKVRIGQSSLIEAEEIDASTLARHCDYDRTKDLVLFRIGSKE